MILVWTTPQAPLGKVPISVVSAVKAQTLEEVILVVAATGSASGQVKNTIYEALALTGVLTVGLGTFAWTTKRNLSFLGPILFIGLLVVVVASIFSIFFSTGPLSFIIALVSVGLFSGFIVYDIQRIKFTENTMSAAILLTISIYLDILNLFLSLLRLFGGSDDQYMTQSKVLEQVFREEKRRGKGDKRRPSEVH